MRREKDLLWTWLLPERAAPADKEEWVRHGGKWIVFDGKDRVEDLADRLEPLIDRGEIRSAKYWNGAPSALCVYCLDEEKTSVEDMLNAHGAGRSRVWEYDYAWDKNIRSPCTFTYSWFSKFSTILRSYGLSGSLRLFREVILDREKSS